MVCLMLSAFPHIHVSVTGMQLQFSKSWREKTGEAKQKRMKWASWCSADCAITGIPGLPSLCAGSGHCH